MIRACTEHWKNYFKTEAAAKHAEVGNPLFADLYDQATAARKIHEFRINELEKQLMRKKKVTADHVIGAVGFCIGSAITLSVLFTDSAAAWFAELFY